MKRLLIILLLFPLFSMGFQHYYVANSGNDAQAGISPVTAWQTTSKVNSSMAIFNPGDTISFECGSTFYGFLNITKSGTAGNYIVYNSYGTGAKPKLFGSKQENSTSDWTNIGTNLWSNNDPAFTNDIGNIIFNGGPTCGFKLMTATPTFTTQGQFWYDFTNHLVKLYSVGNPATFYSDIQCALSTNAVTVNSSQYLKFNNLDFRYYGRCIWEVGGNFLEWRECNMSYVGGLDWLPTHYTERFGNALQMWEGCHDITIRKCIIDNVYDAGISPQGFSTTPYSAYNLFMDSNFISNCEYNFELVEREATSTFHDNTFTYNVCSYAGGGFGHNQRPDGINAANVRFVFHRAVTSNVSISHNIFYQATERLFQTGTTLDLIGVAMDYNEYYTTPIGVYGQNAGVNYMSLIAWKGAISRETNAVGTSAAFVNPEIQQNPTSTPINYSFIGLSKKDAYGNVFNNSATIPAWWAKVLIPNGTVTNTPPIANAGANQSITLPTNTATLVGSATAGTGIITTYQWVKVSGPPGSNFLAGNTATITVTNLLQGTYQFSLTVTDNLGSAGTDTMQITVNAAPNLPPTANAGVSQSITLPTSSVTLTGSGTDTDGTIAGYAWVKTAGPTCTITSPSSATTTVTGMGVGIYTFQLTVTDNLGLTGSDTMQVYVNSLPNVPPTASAGADQVIQLPTNTTTLVGSGSDVDGVITGYLWTKITGIGSSISSPGSSTTGITGLTAGVYTYEIRVTDNLGLTGRDTVQVTVNSAVNTPPTANAGADKVLTLPTNTTTLTGSGTDPDGTIIGYQWLKLAGSPAGSNFTTSTNANLPLTNLVQGVYQFSLTVTDNSGSTGTDTAQVTVNPSPNANPVVNAGADQSITLPTNSVTLSGSATDRDGTIVSYSWSKVSGPASYSIVTVNAATTSVINLVQGTYQFVLTATDNLGATGSDVMTVTVLPNLTPVPSSSIILYNWKIN